MKEKIKKHLEIFAPSDVYVRGKSFPQSAVRIKVMENGHIIADVRGRKKYKTECIHTDKNLSFSCSCPYSYALVCKHCVALGLAILKNDKALQKLNMEPDVEKLNDDNGNILIEELLNSASENELKSFLKTLFQNDAVLLQKFKTLVKGQSNVDTGDSIDDVIRYVKEELEAFDLTDYERFYDDYDGAYYRDYDDILFAGAEKELQEIFDTFTESIDTVLQEDNIIQAVKEICGIYEGIHLANIKNIADEAYIYDGDISDSVLSMFNMYMRKFIPKFIEIEKQPKAVRKIITLLFERINLYDKQEDKFSYDITLFKELFIALLVDEECALQIEENLKSINRPLTESADIFEAIYKLTNDQENWLKIAYSQYETNYNIALKLLKYLEKDKKEFVKVANRVVFKFNGKLLLYLAKNLEKKDNATLYRNILFELGKEEARNYFLTRLGIGEKTTFFAYQKLKENYSKEDILEFLQLIRRKGSENYYVLLLEKEKMFDEILAFAKQNKSSPHIKKYLKPILNIYPLECFKIISQVVKRNLENAGPRALYRDEASKIKLLYEAKDATIVAKGQELTRELLIRYSNRPAMKNEFKQIGIC